MAVTAQLHLLFHAAMFSTFNSKGSIVAKLLVKFINHQTAECILVEKLNKINMVALFPGVLFVKLSCKFLW